MDMYIQMTNNHYYRVFFIAFYFISVIVVLNVFIAFVIELFLLQYTKSYSQNELLFRYKRYVIQSILIHQLYYGQYEHYHWKIDRRLRSALLYQVLFEDKTESAINKSEKQVKQMKNLELMHELNTIDDKDEQRFKYSLYYSNHLNINKRKTDQDEGLIIDDVDYDDCVQMPWGQRAWTDDFDLTKVNNALNIRQGTISKFYKPLNSPPPNPLKIGNTSYKGISNDKNSDNNSALDIFAPKNRHNLQRPIKLYNDSVLSEQTNNTNQTKMSSHLLMENKVSKHFNDGYFQHSLHMSYKAISEDRDK